MGQSETVEDKPTVIIRKRTETIQMRNLSAVTLIFKRNEKTGLSKAQITAAQLRAVHLIGQRPE